MGIFDRLGYPQSKTSVIKIFFGDSDKQRLPTKHMLTVIEEGLSDKEKLVIEHLINHSEFLNLEQNVDNAVVIPNIYTPIAGALVCSATNVQKMVSRYANAGVRLIGGSRLSRRSHHLFRPVKPYSNSCELCVRTAKICQIFKDSGKRPI